MGHGETEFEDAHGEGRLNLHMYTWVDPLEKRHTVEGHTIVQNLLTFLRRVYAPLNEEKLKSNVRLGILLKVYVTKK